MPDLPPIAVIAGGLGTRLYPTTLAIPKSLIEVNGEPFIDHQLRLFARAGIRRAVFCVGHFGEQIVEHVANRGSFGVEVEFSFDGKKLLGTGGSVKKALPLLGDAFLVTYGDSYLDIDYAAAVGAFRASNRPALMTVFRNQDRWDGSNVEFDGREIRAYDKKNRTAAMRHIDYGLLVLRAEVFAMMGSAEAFDLEAPLSRLVAEGRMAGLEVDRRFYEVGSTAGIADLEAYLAERRGEQEAGRR